MYILSFLKLSFIEKAEYVRSRGPYLLGRIEGIYVYKLYHLNDYYVEMKFKYDETNLESLAVFDGTDNLVPWKEFKYPQTCGRMPLCF